MISFEEFNSLPEEEQKSVLQGLKGQVSVKEIIELWGVSRARLYSMQNKLGITNETRKPSKSKDKKTKVVRSPRKTRSNKNSSVDNNHGIVLTDTNAELNLNKDISRFSLQLETTGPASLLADTLKMILLSERVANLNLKVDIQIEQV
jgi:hypothetical protein